MKKFLTLNNENNNFVTCHKLNSTNDHFYYSVYSTIISTSICTIQFNLACRLWMRAKGGLSSSEVASMLTTGPKPR